MFHACKLALGDDDKDERDWELQMAKSRKRQRKKRKDDAAVASFFDHVEDPMAMRIVELLLDYSILDSSRSPCNDPPTFNCENRADAAAADANQEVLTKTTTENDETQDQASSRDCDSQPMEQPEVIGCCTTILEEDLDDGDLTDSQTTNVVDYYSEPSIPFLMTSVETVDSERRTVKTGPPSSETNNVEHSVQSPEHQSSNDANRKGVTSADTIVGSFDARNVKQLLPTGKENNMMMNCKKEEEEDLSPRSIVHDWSKIQRSPLYESSSLISRQQQSLGLHSF